MKTILAVVFCIVSVFAAQKLAHDPAAFKLSDSAAKTLADVADELEKMSPQVSDVKKQRAEAAAIVSQADAWLARYEQFRTGQLALLFKYAADNGLKSTEVELNIWPLSFNLFNLRHLWIKF